MHLYQICMTVKKNTFVITWKDYLFFGSTNTAHSSVYCFIRTNNNKFILLLSFYIHRSSLRANNNLGIGHGPNRHKKDPLSPVPETLSISGARVLEVSGPPISHNSHHPPGGQFGLGSSGGGAFHYSSESVQRVTHQHPADRMGDCNGDGGGPPGVERDPNGHILVRESSFSSRAISSHPPPASVLSNPLRGSMGSISSQSRGGRPPVGVQGDGHSHGGHPHHRPADYGTRVHVAKQGADLPRDISYHSNFSGAGRSGEWRESWVWFSQLMHTVYDCQHFLRFVCECVLCVLLKPTDMVHTHTNRYGTYIPTDMVHTYQQIWYIHTKIYGTYIPTDIVHTHTNRYGTYIPTDMVHTHTNRYGTYIPTDMVHIYQQIWYIYTNRYGTYIPTDMVHTYQQIWYIHDTLCTYTPS